MRQSSPLPERVGPSYIPKILLSSITSILSGTSFQLCRQHTITSHFFGSCPCSRKFLLSYSNSILTSCHFPGATCRLPRPSGSPRVHSDSTWNPSSHATSANRNTTPISFTGAFVSGCRLNGGPITGLSFLSFPCLIPSRFLPSTRLVQDWVLSADC